MRSLRLSPMSGRLSIVESVSLEGFWKSAESFWGRQKAEQNLSRIGAK